MLLGWNARENLAMVGNIERYSRELILLFINIYVNLYSTVQFDRYSNALIKYNIPVYITYPMINSKL